MREAGKVNAEILATVRALIAPGVTTADLNAAADEVLQEARLLLAIQGLRAAAVSRLDLHQRE